MKRRSPTLEGFRAILRRPSFGLAEIAWRWSFGAASALLIAFSFFEYLDTLPVSKTDLLLLRTAQPALIFRAVLDIFRGSTLRALDAVIVLLLALGTAWIVVASLARAATLRALLDYFRELNLSTQERKEEQKGEEKKTGRLHSLLALNFFRLAATLAAIVGFWAAILLGGAASRPANPAPGTALLVMLTITMLVGFAWSTSNWILSLAAIFVVANRENTFGAIAAAVNLCRNRSGSIFAAGTWFGLARLTAFAIATSVAAFPLAFAPVLPAGMVLGGVLLVALLYFAISDFLYIGRLAAYVAILELPDAPISAEAAPPPQADLPLDPTIDPSPAVDPTELILSDTPANS
jgi:hypothetical protein